MSNEPTEDSLFIVFGQIQTHSYAYNRFSLAFDAQLNRLYTFLPLINTPHQAFVIQEPHSALKTFPYWLYRLPVSPTIHSTLYEYTHSLIQCTTQFAHPLCILQKSHPDPTQSIIRFVYSLFGDLFLESPQVANKDKYAYLRAQLQCLVEP